MLLTITLNWRTNCERKFFDTHKFWDLTLSENCLHVMEENLASWETLQNVYDKFSKNFCLLEGKLSYIRFTRTKARKYNSTLLSLVLSCKPISCWCHIAPDVNLDQFVEGLNSSLLLLPDEREAQTILLGDFNVDRQISKQISNKEQRCKLFKLTSFYNFDQQIQTPTS